MEFNGTKKSYGVIDIVHISLMSAIVYVATAMLNVPVGLGYKGVVHLGDSAVFLAALFLGRKKAAISSAIGMSLFDLLSPYAIWAPYTFFIKGIMGYIAATIAYRNNYEGENIINNIAAFVVAGIWMNGAYYLAGVFMNHFYAKVPLNQCWFIQLTHIPGDIAQVVVGILIAIPIGQVLIKAKLKKLINK